MQKQVECQINTEIAPAENIYVRDLKNVQQTNKYKVLFRVDDYRIYKKLGSGISGNVFAAVDGLNRQFALKIYNNNCQAAFESEILAYAQLKHPHIANLIQVLKGKQILYKGKKMYINCIILEYLQYGDLFDLVVKGKLGEQLALYLFKQVLKGVSYMHIKGFVHLDLKPENILIDKHLNLKIVDFGFAISNKQKGIGQLKLACGTLSYMAPEVLEKKEYNGTSADIFSLGIILFILVTGHPPFMKAVPEDPHFKYIVDNNFNAFWVIHQRAKQTEYNMQFKQLVYGMLRYDPDTRISMANIIGSPWLQQSYIYELREIQEFQNTMINIYKTPLDEPKKDNQVTRGVNLFNTNEVDELTGIQNSINSQYSDNSTSQLDPNKKYSDQESDNSDIYSFYTPFNLLKHNSFVEIDKKILHRYLENIYIY